ncbi:MAG TPA: hypothetical protein VMZ06_01305 [Candidatus Bathyarchaeia archaeon]|nr:hypothetical protein [Candidatus Bathyarchaeia archaeon]
MKRIGLLLAVCVVAAIGVLLITHYYKHTTGDIVSKKPGPLNVDLPEATKNGQPQETAPLDDEIAAALDAKLITDTRRAVHDVELAKIKETIQQINKPFTDVKFEEVPAEFRLKMQPAEDYEAHGGMFHYFMDEAGNILVEAGIQDYGECTSTVAYDAEEAFKQSLQFNQPTQVYFGSYKRTWREARETQTYLWKDTGAWEPPPGVERYLSLWPAKLDFFASRKLSKGEQVSTVLEGLYEATYEVLGYAEIEGHKTVVFEQRIPDCPMHEALGVPPFKREVSRRFYLDIETSMPLRAEGRVVSYFTDEHRNNPKLPGIIPESGIQQTVWVYQVDL